MNKHTIKMLGAGLALLAIILLFFIAPKPPRQTRSGSGGEDADQNSVLPFDGTVESRDAKFTTAMDAVQSTNVPYATRMDAIFELGYDLSPEHVDEVMAFLNAPMPSDSELSVKQYNALRNNALNLLLEQKTAPDDVMELLVDSYHDVDKDAVWRNYCLQFIRDFYELRTVRAPVDAKPSLPSSTPFGETDEAVLAQETLWAALSERDNSNAAAALLALEKLSRDHPEFDREAVGAAMLDLASDGRATIANRVSAIRLCGENQVEEALPIARELAENGETTMLRCAAIATLGELGNEEDLETLKELASSPNPRVSQIAQTTLSKRML